MTAEELSAVFCEELVAQELDNEKSLYPDPEEIQSFYKMYRPSPLVRAYCLEEKLQTPAHIYYKFGGQQHQWKPQAQLRRPPGPITPKNRVSRA